MHAQVTTAALEAWVRRFADLIAEHRDQLTELDAAIGDADHGSNMERGMKAVLSALDEDAPATPGALLKKVGITLVSKVGGASGPLFGTFFLRMSGSLGGLRDRLDDRPGRRPAGRPRRHRRPREAGAR